MISQYFAVNSEGDSRAELDHPRLVHLASDRAKVGRRYVDVRAPKDSQVEDVERSDFERQTHIFADAELSPQADVLAFGGWAAKTLHQGSWCVSESECCRGNEI